MILPAVKIVEKTDMRPLWARCKQITGLFGVGKDQIQQWREQGIVKVAVTSGRNVVYRTADFDRAINQIAEGRSPIQYEK